ncbi:MAG: TIGR00282 family metallophosphoesterase [Candidatus Berkelbacteria bacterium]|nr:TIGR00282 family metallophosphoesterase [Candidatus Berkelbacteria bacterium]
MKILFIGDIVGRPGRNASKKLIPELVAEHGIDFVVANGENLASGTGMTFKTYAEMTEAGVDYFTSGNHIWKNKDIIEHLDDSTTKIIRPLNYPAEAPGRGFTIVEKDKKKFLLVNAQGRVFIHDDLEDPFTALDRIANENTDIPIIVDFHAEATSEKIALGRYLDGKVAAVVGTHTHVQTADETIFPGGTGYITDVGMVGPINSVLGVEKEIIIEKFLTQLPASHKVASGEVNFSAVVISIDPEKKICSSILRINSKVNLSA